MEITGAEAIVQSLIHEGVEVLFGYPGGAIMPTYDALYDVQNQLRHVLVRHEQGASHAAEGYARATGKPGVCLATSGPGATNLITGITDAMLDSVPMVCITGQVAAPLLGSDAFQESDILGMTVPITKWNYQVTHASEIAPILAKAFYLARNGRPGPVLIDITKDAQFGKCHFDYQPYSAQLNNHHSFHLKELDSLLIKQAANLIDQAKKPMILAGHGILISGAEQELQAFAEKTGIPVCCTLLGLSCIPSEHDLCMGMLGMHGNYGPNVLSNESDCVIAVGMRFDDRVTGDVKRYLKGAKVIHIDIDQAEMNKNVAADVGIVADAKVALTALCEAVTPNQHPVWLSRFASLAEMEHDQVIEPEIHSKTGQIRMAEVIHKLHNKAPNDTIIVTDVGQHQMVTARYFQFAQPNTHITSGGLGTMGFAIPAAIGAKFGAPNRQVIAIAGDGGFQMTLQELGVLSQEGIAVKLIILNNNFLGMVRQWQELFFDSRYSFTELQNPNFIKIAEGYGIAGQRIEKREQLDQALDTLLAAKESYLLDIAVEKQHNVFPMVPSGASVCEMRLK